MGDSIEALQEQGIIDSKKVALIKICLVTFFGTCMSAVLMAQIFSVWLDKDLHLDSLQIGELMALKGIVAICYKPLFGYLLDKMQLRINFIISIPLLGLLSGPFFQFVYKPLIMTQNPTYFYLAGLLGGVYCGYTVIAGGAAIFSYGGRYLEAHGGQIDKIGAAAFMGWLVMGFGMTMMYTFNPMWSFYLASFAGLCMMITLFTLKVKPFDNLNTKTTSAEKIKLVDVKHLIFNPRFYVLAFFSTTIIVVIYAQYSQIGRYVLTFWPADKQTLGLRVGAYLNIPINIGIFVLMLFASSFIKKLNSSKSLIVLSCSYGIALLALALAGLLKNHMEASNYIPSLIASIIAYDLMSLVNPFTQIVILSYVTASFDKRVTGIAFLIGFHFICNLAGSAANVVIGEIFNVYGWSNTYFVMTVFVFVCVLVLGGLMHFSNLYDKKRILAHLGRKQQAEENDEVVSSATKEA